MFSRNLVRCFLSAGVSFVIAWGSATAIFAAEVPASVSADGLKLHLRERKETAAGSGRYHTLVREQNWDPKKTCLVVCDMWDKHWCENATRRVGEMAPRMNEVITAARKCGVFIIHCPSDTMAFYADAPGRKLAQAAPKVEPKVPLKRWCHLDKAHEAPLPIDDTDGGCDTPDAPKSYRAWSRQIATLQIETGDAITESDEAYFLMRERGIENVIVMGVHTNMCVLGRPFSIRQMVAQGMNVVLMRDMTDTMYNPRKAPFVHHCTGTDLIVEHIEKYWCPSITSVDFLGGKEFRFAEDQRKHCVILAAEDEYKTEISLPAFASKHLGQAFRVSFMFADEANRDRLPGAEVLADADLMLVSVRRRGATAEQLAKVRRHVAAGKPVIGIRTASHAFAPFKGKSYPPEVAFWPEFDAEVFGGHYTGHHGVSKEPETMIRIATGAEAHPLLKGVENKEFLSSGSLYKTSPLAAETTVLLMGRSGDRQPHEPVAWTFQRADGGRSFYTSLGHADDFKSAAFETLLLNAINWSVAKP
jgi:nicotinamidase-related amidase/type 1 glutamine amidotransferase